MNEIPDAVARAVGPARTATGVRMCVAFSGGLDSTVLLHALSRAGVRALRAVYVNHQLHPDAADWGRRCERFCRGLGVGFSSVTVNVAADEGGGLEAAARRSRYRALAADLGDGETLVTAHHGDDQVETVLLNLMRGSGVAGVAGIPRDGPIGSGRLWRPFLELPRAALRAYAVREGLNWIEDPANTDTRMDRNFLRHRILPALESRWPGVRATVARSARLSDEAADLLEELAQRDARRISRGGHLSVAALAGLSGPRQRNLLRYVCRRGLGSVPSERRLHEGISQLLAAGEDRRPLLAWAGGEIRRYRARLYVLRPLGPPPEPGLRLQMQVQTGAALNLGGALGRLRLVRSRAQGLARERLGEALQVSFRQGGEHIRLASHGPRRELKKLLQERGVVPWMRSRIPLLYDGASLVAVGGLWVATEFAAGPGEHGLRVKWDQHPAIE